MDSNEDKIRKLCKDGIITKDEMDAELKKESHTQKSSRHISTRWIIGIITICVIICATFFFISHEENDLINNSFEVESLLAADDGSITDRMTIDGTKPLFFHLGEFKDIDGYSDYAKKKLRGKVVFDVCVTKDGSSLAIIQITPKFTSQYGAYTPGESEEVQEEITYVGSTIFESGRKWIIDFSTKEKVFGWQPNAKWNNVKLTPKAEIKAAKLLCIISRGKISKKDGKFYAGEYVFTDSEVKDMIKFGILKKKNIFSSPEVSEDYNKAISRR